MLIIMNLSKITPKDLANQLLDRSTCKIKVAAVIEDNYGIYSWGWNHAGDGLGCHAEAMAIRRANPSRLKDSTIYVVGKRNYSVYSLPCMACMGRIIASGISKIVFRDKLENWITIVP